MFMRRIAGTALPYLIAVAASLAAAGIFIAAMGFDVLKAFETILFTSFRTPYGFSQTVAKFVPLVLQALAFTVPLAAGVFNIGGEGQMIVGAIGAAAVGILFADLPAVVLLPLVILGGVLAGVLWGFIPGLLLYQFKINEILTTVLLNFVSFALINYVATGAWRDPTAGHPTTIPIGEGGFMPVLIKNPPFDIGILIAVLVTVAVYFYTNRSVSGYELVATGANRRAAQVYGINTRRMFVLSLVIGGALGEPSASRPSRVNWEKRARC